MITENNQRTLNAAPEGPASGNETQKGRLDPSELPYSEKQEIVKKALSPDALEAASKAATRRIAAQMEVRPEKTQISKELKMYHLIGVAKKHELFIRDNFEFDKMTQTSKSLLFKVREFYPKKKPRRRENLRFSYANKPEGVIPEDTPENFKKFWREVKNLTCPYEVDLSWREIDDTVDVNLVFSPLRHGTTGAPKNGSSGNKTKRKEKKLMPKANPDGPDNGDSDPDDSDDDSDETDSNDRYSTTGAAATPPTPPKPVGDDTKIKPRSIRINIRTLGERLFERNGATKINLESTTAAVVLFFRQNPEYQLDEPDPTRLARTTPTQKEMFKIMDQATKTMLRFSRYETKNIEGISRTSAYQQGRVLATNPISSVVWKVRTRRAKCFGGELDQSPKGSGLSGVLKFVGAVGILLAVVLLAMLVVFITISMITRGFTLPSRSLSMAWRGSTGRGIWFMVSRVFYILF